MLTIRKADLDNRQHAVLISEIKQHPRRLFVLVKMVLTTPFSNVNWQRGNSIKGFADNKFLMKGSRLSDSGLWAYLHKRPAHCKLPLPQRI